MLDFQGDISREEMLVVQLQPAVEEAAPVPSAVVNAAHVPPRDRPVLKVVDYSLAGALVAAGGVHLAFGIRQLMHEDHCAKSVGGECVSRYGDNHTVSTSWITTGAGIAGVVLGAAVAVWTPVYRLSVRGTAQTAHLSVARSF
jgi:hypothetical protein